MILGNFKSSSPRFSGRKRFAVAAATLLVAFPFSSTSAFSLSMSAASSSKSQSPRSIVVVGGGVQACSVAYHLATSSDLPPASKITILEAKQLANAASGKGGGFMARSWGDGGPTQTLHHLAFDLYPKLAEKLGCKTYRKLPVLSVSPGQGGVNQSKKNPTLKEMLPGWLDGNVGRISPLGMGDDTAQITPKEFTHKLIEGGGETIDVVLGTCTGIKSEENKDGTRKVTGVIYKARPIKDDEDREEEGEEKTLECDAIVVSAGPWSCSAEDWFDGSVSLPMEGVKSTSIVWKAPEGKDIDATALFCGEDYRFGTHLEVYPRPDNTIYLCGIGGSDYISTEDLKAGAFREVCEAKPDRVKAASDSFQEMSAEYRSHGELDRVQACMRPCPPDAMPYMGKIPGFDGAFINAGHNCWGIAWAPACGVAISELVLTGSSRSVDLSPFDPARFTPKRGRGGRGRKKQGTSVGEQW